MVSGLFKPLAQVSKLRICKDLVFTKVSLGTKVISYAVAGVMGKVVKPQVQRFQKRFPAPSRTFRSAVDSSDVQGHIKILGVHSHVKTRVSDDDCEKIARRTPGFSGAYP
jgi:hypothetical protein